MTSLRDDPFPADPGTLELIVAGYALSNVVFSAVELELFDALVSGPANSHELSARLNVSLDGIDRLCCALVAMALLRSDGLGNYSNTELAQAALTREAPLRSVVLHHQRHLAPLFARLSPAVRSGKTQLDAWPFGTDRKGGCYERLHDSPAEYELFSRAIDASSAGIGVALAEQFKFADVRSLVDLGGGGGQVAGELASAVPALEITIVDLPEACRRAEAHIAALGFSERVRTMDGDIRTAVPLAKSADAVLLSAVLADWPVAEQAQIMATARRCVRPEGWILVSENSAARRSQRTFVPTLLSLAMLLAFGGRNLTEADVVALFNQHGFAHEKTWLNHSRGIRDLVVGRAVS